MITMTRTDVADLAARTRALLTDPDADLTATTRARHEGVLTACEVINGEAPTLLPDEMAAQVRSVL